MQQAPGDASATPRAWSAGRKCTPGGSDCPCRDAQIQKAPGCDQLADDVAAAANAAAEGVVRTIDGGELRCAADTLCIHGDGPRAIEIATAVRAALAAAGIDVRTATGRARSR